MLLGAQAQLVLFDYWWLFTEQCSGEQGEEGPPGVAAAGVADGPLGAERRPTLWCLQWQWSVGWWCGGRCGGEVEVLLLWCCVGRWEE